MTSVTWFMMNPISTRSMALTLTKTQLMVSSVPILTLLKTLIQLMLKNGQKNYPELMKECTLSELNLKIHKNVNMKSRINLRQLRDN